MSPIPEPVPPLRRPHTLDRGLPPTAAVDWLRAGWRDLRAQPGPSLVYGLGVCLLSYGIVASLFFAAYDYILFPALAAFMVVAPALAVGLYEKSRNLADGKQPGLRDMLRIRPRTASQLLFIGLMLSLLALLWIRAAVLLYALFFGLQPFPGFDGVATTLIATRAGWLLLATGTAVGALFASFAFAISALSLPMIVDRPIDALTAMGHSMSLVWNNLPSMLSWGAFLLAGYVICMATGLLGLGIVFPLAGHATWHAYRAVDPRG